jgi:hypothetical protein
VIGIFDGKTLLEETNTRITAQQIADQTAPLEISLLPDIPNRSYEVRFGIKSKNYEATHNSETIHVTHL